MANIYLLLIASLIVWYFWTQRKIAEAARYQAKNYCEQENLQYIATAKVKSRLKFNKSDGPHWLSHYALEFSSDGQSSYMGEVTMKDYKLKAVNLPPYRLN